MFFCSSTIYTSLNFSVAKYVFCTVFDTSITFINKAQLKRYYKQTNSQLDNIKHHNSHRIVKLILTHCHQTAMSDDARKKQLQSSCAVIIIFITSNHQPVMKLQETSEIHTAPFTTQAKNMQAGRNQIRNP